MRDLIHDPAWRASDLGVPLPDSPYAVSVAMPEWAHVLAYEEEDPEVIARLQCGYPRFLVHPRVRELFDLASQRYAGADGEGCLVLPNPGAAERCAEFLARRGVPALASHATGWGALTALVVPPDGLRAALEFWRYSGEIVSSRVACAVVSAGGETDLGGVGGGDGEGTRSVSAIGDRIAGLAGVPADHVFLYGTGMQATFTVHRMLSELRPELPSLQLEFPYVDVLKVQKVFGGGEHFFPVVEPGDRAAVEALVGTGQISGVYCEIASNPLMRSIDFESLKPVLDRAGVPLVVDDTVASVANVDVYRFADVVTTSLTKYFAGSGDVMGGSVVVNPASRFAGDFKRWLADEPGEFGTTLWSGDAEVIERASRDFGDRMAKVNATSEALCAMLCEHPKVARVHYPSLDTSDWYEQVRRVGGGYGGLLSVELDDPEREAPRFYDRLRVSKGPSFGAGFTLACPYTLLAHYRELDWAERCGVSRWMIRVGVGLEEADDIVRRFEAALGG